MDVLDETVDVLVAGYGGGVAGAYTAAREGLSVALVEATDQLGGTFAYSGGGGMWFPCNPVLVRAGSDDTIEEALRYYRNVVGDRTPAELQETYVRGGAALTRTSCVSPPTCSVTLRPTTASPSTMMPSRTNVPNPSSETVTRYVPGWSGVSA